MLGGILSWSLMRGWAAHPLDPHPATTAFGAQPPVDTVATNDKVWPHTGHPLGRSGYASSLQMPKMSKMLTPSGYRITGAPCRD